MNIEKTQIKKNYTMVSKDNKLNNLSVEEYITYHILLRSRNNSTKVSYCGYNRLAKLVGISKSSISKVLESLVSLNLIDIVLKKSNYSNEKFEYTFPEYDNIKTFEKVPNTILELTDISKNAKYFLIKMFQFTFNDYSYKYKQKELASMLDLSIPQVARILKELKCSEYLVERRKKVKESGKGSTIKMSYINTDKLFDKAEVLLEEKNQEIQDLNVELSKKDKIIAKYKAMMEAENK